MRRLQHEVMLGCCYNYPPSRWWWVSRVAGIDFDQEIFIALSAGNRYILFQLSRLVLQSRLTRKTVIFETRRGTAFLRQGTSTDLVSSTVKKRALRNMSSTFVFAIR